MRKTILVIAIAIAAIALTAFAGLDGTGLFGLGQADEGTVQIGVMLPLTGDAAIYGESMGTALELAREQINSDGGILGKKVEFVIEDSACDAKKGVDAINSLVHLKGMKLVIAAECSGPALSAAPVAEDSGILYLVPAASNPDIKDAGDYVFRISPSDNQQGKDLAELLYAQGYKNVAAMFMDNAYGKGIATVFMQEFENLGGTIAEQQQFGQNNTDFRTQLLKIKEAGPDAIFLVAYPQSHQLIIKQMGELGVKKQVFATDTFKDQSILDGLGGEADGVIFSTFAESKSPEFQKFREDYEQEYGKEYGPFGDYAYDSLYVLKAGIEQANSFDPEVLKNSLYSLEYNGVTGLTKFDSFGEVDKPYAIYIVKNGKFVELEG